MASTSRRHRDRGLSRPANTVGGDFYDICRLGTAASCDGCDVAAKPRPRVDGALLAMLRTLVDERLEPSCSGNPFELQGAAAPGTRRIRCCSRLDPASVSLLCGTRVTAAAASCQRRLVHPLTEGVCAGCSHDYTTGASRFNLMNWSPSSDALQSGETEWPPFDEAGRTRSRARTKASCRWVRRVAAFELHGRHPFADDLTILYSVAAHPDTWGV